MVIGGLAGGVGFGAGSALAGEAVHASTSIRLD